MGQEVTCTVRHRGKSAKGKALLETSELILRGDLRLKIPFSAITSLRAVDVELHVRTRDGVTVFELGEQAETWREKIANPKSLIEKLGPKAGDAVVIVGKFEAGFLRDLKKVGAAMQEKVSGETQWIFLAAEERESLKKVAVIAKVMQGAAGLWIVYAKGKKELTENDVRGAGLKAGLVDVKVARFSEMKTGLKFVVRKRRR
ncbi:MAG: hypothetical protein WCE52_09345 [Candidatus Acidiferrum sp.]